MIKRLVIENFKTIGALDLPCKRYNIFVGDTNTGKTNILEALTLLSQAPYRSPEEGFDHRILRYGHLNDLFARKDVSVPIRVSTDGVNVVASYKQDLLFHFEFTDMNGRMGTYKFQPAGNQVDLPSANGLLDTIIRRYQYDPNVVFGPHWFSQLAPPDGKNLTALLMSNADLLNEVNEIMGAREVFLNIDGETYALTQRLDRTKHVSVQLPYASVSETLKRYVFLYAAVRTNKDAVLLLDEPEQNTFPFYTKHIAEIMAREPSNQYFIATHNQYLLQSIMEKAPADDVQVIATYRKEGATSLRVVPMEEVLELMEYDLFLNLDRLVEP